MKIICVGRNYSEHIQELNNATPENPVIFLKPDTALLKDNQPFFIPPWSKDMHYETEVVFKIGKPGKFIQEQFVHKYISQYTVGIDFTERFYQSNLKAKGLPWELSKAFDGSAVVGQWMDYSMESVDFQNIDFSMSLNDVIVQKGNTKDMIFNLNKIVSFVSEFFTLKTGDLIFTGTPVGVGNVHIGDKLKGFINESCLFEFEIK